MFHSEYISIIRQEKYRKRPISAEYIVCWKFAIYLPHKNWYTEIALCSTACLGKGKALPITGHDGSEGE